jgi:carbon storage regulator CsrA
MVSKRSMIPGESKVLDLDRDSLQGGFQMLVLSRHVNQEIVFPSLGITVSVVRVQGSTVRVGIEAPSDIRVLRGELTRASHEVSQQREMAPSAAAGAVDLHHVRNCLNTAVLALRIASKRAQLDPKESASMIATSLRELNQIKQSLGDIKLDELPNLDLRVDGNVERRSASWRALLVEDNDNERQLLAGYLRISGFDVAEVNNGHSAIRYLEQNEVPDVLLLDMNMPKFNGAKTVNWIRESERLRSLRIFGVSGPRGDRSRLPHGSQGVDHWIEKPINPEMVVKQMSRAIEYRVGQTA